MGFKKGEEWAGWNNAASWVMMSVVIGLVVLVVAIIISTPIGYLIAKGVSKDSIDYIKQYFAHIATRPDIIITTYWRWINSFFGWQGPAPLYMWMVWLPLVLMVLTTMIGIAINPHEFMVTLHGAGRLANTKDIKKMKLLNGFVIVLGRWKGKLLKLPETLSVLAVAPPGTGKTVGVVVPTILNSPGLSLIVNDPKPELCYQTSGYRSQEGPVFIINWGAEDDPEKGIFFPSWNPLSSSCLPSMGPGRDMYIELKNQKVVLTLTGQKLAEMLCLVLSILLYQNAKEQEQMTISFQDYMKANMTKKMEKFLKVITKKCQIRLRLLHWKNYAQAN